MSPEIIWESSCALYLCPDGTFAPEFGAAASSLMGGGHVTVLKAAANSGETRHRGKMPSYRGHVTVLKAAATGGGGGNSSKAQDHNSTRSNKTAS